MIFFMSAMNKSRGDIHRSFHSLMILCHDNSQSQYEDNRIILT